MRTKLLILAAVLVGAGAFAYWYQDRYGIKSDVREVFKDPESVIFGNISVFEDKACVDVNARNGWGAYTGMKTYYVVQIGDQWSVIDSIDFKRCLELASGVKLNF